MANLQFQSALAGNGAFSSRVQAALINAALAIVSEVADETQTITVTGSPTGGQFVLNALPGTVIVQNGTLTSASATVSALTSTAGLFTGMAVSGTNVPANTTVATITSATAITLSANASGSGAQSLTFAGGGVAVIPFNATAFQVQTILGQLTNVGANNVVCSGGPLPGTPIVITFTNTLGSRPLILMGIATNSLTGGSSPAPSVARTTAGVAYVGHAARVQQAIRLLYGNYDVFRYSLAVAGNATVQGRFDAALAPNTDEATIASDIQFTVNSNWNAFN